MAGRHRTGGSGPTRDPAPRATPGAGGRPREPRVDEAVLDAVLDLVVECGVAGVTVLDVARRAGVSRSSVYRRWPDKDELVLHAVESLFRSSVPEPATTELRDRIAAVLTAVLAVVADPRARRVLPRLLTETTGGSTLLTGYRDRVVAPRREQLLALLTDAAAIGALAPGLDPELAADLLIGPIVYRVITHRELPPAQHGRPGTDVTAYAHALIRAVLPDQASALDAATGGPVSR